MQNVVIFARHFPLEGYCNHVGRGKLYPLESGRSSGYSRDVSVVSGHGTCDLADGFYGCLDTV